LIPNSNRASERRGYNRWRGDIFNWARGNCKLKSVEVSYASFSGAAADDTG
jgi:hypothetical protein